MLRESLKYMIEASLGVLTNANKIKARVLPSNAVASASWYV
jgi:hypothetical protein